MSTMKRRFVVPQLNSESCAMPDPTSPVNADSQMTSPSHHGSHTPRMRSGARRARHAGNGSPSFVSAASPAFSDTNLFLRHLPLSVDDVMLRSVFEQFGVIVSATVMRNIRTGESLGTAFVRFEAQEAAKTAFTFFKGTGRFINGQGEVEQGGSPVARGKKEQGKGEAPSNGSSAPPSPSGKLTVQWAKRQHDEALVGEKRQRVRKLFLRNIPTDITEEALFALCSTYGPVEQVTLHSDTAAHQPAPPCPGSSKKKATAALNTDPDADPSAVEGHDATPAGAPAEERLIAFITFLADGCAANACDGIHNSLPFPSCNNVRVMAKLAEDTRQRTARRSAFLGTARGHAMSNGGRVNTRTDNDVANEACVHEEAGREGGEVATPFTLGENNSHSSSSSSTSHHDHVSAAFAAATNKKAGHDGTGGTQTSTETTAPCAFVVPAPRTRRPHAAHMPTTGNMSHTTSNANTEIVTCPSTHLTAQLHVSSSASSTSSSPARMPTVSVGGSIVYPPSQQQQQQHAAPCHGYQHIPVHQPYTTPTSHFTATTTTAATVPSSPAAMHDSTTPSTKQVSAFRSSPASPLTGGGAVHTRTTYRHDPYSNGVLVSTTTGSRDGVAPATGRATNIHVMRAAAASMEAPFMVPTASLGERRHSHG